MRVLFLMDNGRRWVCRINVHDRDLDKIGREAKNYRWLHQVAPDLPLALDYLPDCSKKLLPFDYALIPFLEGRGVGEAIESLPKTKRNALLEEIGRLLRRFHRIRVPFFGNRLDDPRVFPKEASWPDYLRERFAQALSRCEKDLGGPPTWKEGLTLRFVEGLQAVPEQIEPVFLHGDFHYDNLLFMESDSGAPRISGSSTSNGPGGETRRPICFIWKKRFSSTRKIAPPFCRVTRKPTGRPSR
ncbi:MAG: aminoglycoside phosphotransferase family protein [Candidatus Manganitrophus sp.]|nr:MAG: aminoglycoside phosphotransferase family protein [Candidatus Manganitrophus sp.]